MEQSIRQFKLAKMGHKKATLSKDGLIRHLF
jgi:hypothetical protein